MGDSDVIPSITYTAAMLEVLVTETENAENLLPLFADGVFLPPPPKKKSNLQPP